MRSSRQLLFVAALTLAWIPGEKASAQFVQQGNKLVGTGAAGNAQQGFSVALSSDGNTAMVGGVFDSSGAGAAWVYTRSGGVWSQQGNKLVASDALGNAQQGSSVSLSSDGNTAIVGGPLDNASVGAAWVFIRGGGTWSQQAKLVGTGAIGTLPLIAQGSSVSLSGDGNTAILGGPGDNYNAGAAWVFTRTGDAWTQQAKLVGTGAANIAWQGYAVSLSSDGNTAIVGGPWDSSYTGAAWVFTRNGDVWSQQARLVGSGVVVSAQQGISVSLSSDGNTVIVGGYGDNGGLGAAWVFTRSGDVWSQQGDKLVGTGAVGIPIAQGYSVSIASDGNTAIVGGYADNSHVGAAWVFNRNGNVWSQQGLKLVGTGASGIARQGTSVSLSSDGTTAIVGGDYDNTGVGAAWVFTQSGSAVGEQTAEVPQQTSLEQNYPNPFNPETRIGYTIAGIRGKGLGTSDVKLAVYDLLGREVAVLVNEKKAPGNYTATFDAAGLATGVYLYRLTAGNSIQTCAMLLLK